MESRQHVVKVSKLNCAQFCQYATDFVNRASETEEESEIEIEYRVAVDEYVFQQVCEALARVEGVQCVKTTYTVVHFPSNVRVVSREGRVAHMTLRNTQGEGDMENTGDMEDAESTGFGANNLAVQRKQTLLRLCVGTVGLSPLRGVVAAEQDVEPGEVHDTYTKATRHLLSGGMDIDRASTEPPLPKKWLRTAWPKLKWVTVGKGSKKRFLVQPIYVDEKHLAFGQVSVPAFNFVLPERQKKAYVPVHVRKCWRQTFQWDPHFKIDCTIMHQGAERVIHHIEVECCGSPVPFPPPLSDLLSRVCGRKKC